MLEVFRIRLHILDVENGVFSLEILEITGIIAHQHAIIHIRRCLRELVQPDGGGDLDVFPEIGLQHLPHVHEELEIGLAGARGPS